VPWKASCMNLLYDLHNEKVVPADATEEYTGSFKSKGGVLADVVGLGKTVERKSAHRMVD
jgi:SNF2 family DNA or RNA helicase